MHILTQEQKNTHAILYLWPQKLISNNCGNKEKKFKTLYFHRGHTNLSYITRVMNV